MKAARLVVLTVAIGAGGVAAMLAGHSDKPAEVKPEAPKIATTDILVAKSDIAMGQALSPGDVQWQEWPASTTGGNFIRKTDNPGAIDTLAGRIARAPFVAGEPIRDAKLVDAKGAGYMAAILPSGMRAVSTQISPETGAGGFILPNDRVDVIVTRRDAEKTGGNDQTAETVLNNIRVLAIDQNIEEKGGQRVVVGKTATLELSPRQAETLAVSRQMGTLSLALRSLVDFDGADKPEARDDTRRTSVNMVRFGVTTTATTK